MSFARAQEDDVSGLICTGKQSLRMRETIICDLVEAVVGLKVGHHFNMFVPRNCGKFYLAGNVC